ncbi:MAG: right-handed parallel beta-helix repeat-containing protein, partial [Actinobacteria bacterium]|nr:right-handed parallel beta-helix repeat-containing protein [Actinomycetota bacterium]
MNRIRKKTVAIMATPALVFVGTVFASPASANHVSCGSTITQSTTLHGNVGPCAEGITITANNIVLNLNGFTIFGVATQGEGPGITLDDVSGVTVRGGRVTQFDAGVYITGGGNNIVQGMNVDDNIGPPSPSFGDGIVIEASNNNTIRNNRVRHNGPFDGIGLIAGASFNTIDSNIVDGNNLATFVQGNPNPVVQQDDGIRIEGPGSKSNIVVNNTVRGSSLDGIAVFRFFNQNTDNVIRGNNVIGNGFHSQPGQRKGNGIILFGGEPLAAGANQNLVQANTVVGNAANGIRVEARQNRILDNRTSDNGSAALGPAFDLFDLNPNCDNNVWRRNTYETA